MGVRSWRKVSVLRKAAGYPRFPCWQVRGRGVALPGPDRRELENELSTIPFYPDRKPDKQPEGILASPAAGWQIPALMNPPETDYPDAQPPAAAPGRTLSRRRRKSRASKWLWAGAGLMAVAGVGAVFGLQMWVRHYLRSAEFAEKVNVAAMSAMHARSTLEDLSWQDSTVHAARFEARGMEAASFKQLTVTDARAEVDIGALWDRTWRVKRISVARVDADFSPERLPALPGSDPLSPTATDEGGGGSGGEGSHWLQRWLPNRADIGPVAVDRFDFHWTGENKTVRGGGLALELTPNLAGEFTAVTGSGGTARMEGEGGKAHALTIHSLQATLRRDALRVDQFQGEISRAPVRAEGTLSLTGTRDLSLTLSVDQTQLADWIPDDWLKRCSGVASVEAKVRAGGADFGKFTADGKVRLKDALIQALPLLDVIAKKTRNETFLRLLVKDAVSDFTRLPDGGWRFDKLRADAPGLLRLKGSAAAGSDGALNGEMLLGIVPGTLRYLAGAEQTVFLPMQRAELAPNERALLTSDDSGLLWTRLRLRGTLDRPSEDLSDRLAMAWFNATADQVAGLSMEAAAKAAETASGVAGKVLEVAPPVLERAPALLNEGVKSGLNVLDGLLPR